MASLAERFWRLLLLAAAVIAVLTSGAIVLALTGEAVRFFGMVGPLDFLFGWQWSPQLAMRADQVGASGAFGLLPLLAGTLLITLIALLVAVPLGMLNAIWLAEYAPDRARRLVKPMLELLAGVPTVVYGFLASLVVAPLIRDLAQLLGWQASAQSALAAGLVMGVMIMPFITSLADDVLGAVPATVRQGAWALGSTKAEMVLDAVLPAARPGLLAALVLAFSRALGETMIVVMAAGMIARLTANPLEAVTTITVQIASLLVGDQEFDNPKTLAAFALGLTLFVLTLLLNMGALRHLQRRAS